MHSHAFKLISSDYPQLMESWWVTASTGLVLMQDNALPVNLTRLQYLAIV